MENKQDKRNKYFFGLGTVGRDMFYTMVSMFLMVYLTEVLSLPDSTMWWITAIFTVMRIFDAVNDPIMGLLVDNTKSRFGKFKPWIAIGGITGGILMILMFTDLSLTGWKFLVIFALLYLLWDILYGANDIAYWSMLPSLTTNQKERERMGSFARICASVGMFAVVVGILPITNMLGEALGSLKTGWTVFAIIIVLLMLGFSCFTLFGVKEKKGYFKQEDNTSLREMFRALFKNDQLMWVALSLSLFMIGYTTTTSFGTYYFKYAFGDENMYSIFAAVLGVSQLAALSIFPLVGRHFSRKKLYTGATILVVLGYLLFFFAPMNMIFIGIAGLLLFVGQAFIQTLMLMFLSDSIEYGQWKFGKRNESITFSVQPFVYKIAGAIASGVVLGTVILSGINSAATPADVTAEGITMLKVAMMILPLIAVVGGYFIYLKKYKLDEKTYANILQDLKDRGEIIEK